MHKDKLYMHKKIACISPFGESCIRSSSKWQKSLEMRDEANWNALQKTEQNGTKSNMNSVHIAHGALRTSQSFIHVKSTASHRAFLTFFARNGESG